MPRREGRGQVGGFGGFFFAEAYLAAHNARFAVPAEEPASAFVVVPAGAEDLAA